MYERVDVEHQNTESENHVLKFKTRPKLDFTFYCVCENFIP